MTDYDFDRVREALIEFFHVTHRTPLELVPVIGEAWDVYMNDLTKQGAQELATLYDAQRYGHPR